MPDPAEPGKQLEDELEKDKAALPSPKVVGWRKKANKKGLALSGGGYRASLFHIGALWRLNELGWLPKLDYITSVSGGSIVAAYLGMRWNELGFEKVGERSVAKNFESKFVKPLRDMCATDIELQTIGLGLLNPWGSLSSKVDGKSVAKGTVGLLGKIAEKVAGGMAKSVATSVAQPFAPLVATGVDAATTAWDLNPFATPPELLIKTYDRLLFHGKTLQDLPEPKKNVNPEFVLYATNMQSGVSVRMSKRRLADWRVGEVEKPDVPLARAVAASSGFPPFYVPVPIEIPLDRWRRKGGDLFDRTELRERMDLADGAVYDNMGLTTLLINCQTVLVSDAGALLDIKDSLSLEWLSQVVRTLTVAMDQSNKLRKGSLIGEYLQEDEDRKGEDGQPMRERDGAYWAISDRLKNPKSSWKEEVLLKDSARTRALGSMRTRLNHFTDKEQEDLINWGYALADARMRRWVTKGEKKGQLPYPNRAQ